MTTVMSFANQLKAVYPHLTKTEKKCAKYIHEHLDTINNQTLSQISKDAGVGEATIMRFVYKLGYENLAQFKIAVLKENLENQKKEDNENYVDSYVNKITHLMKDSILANDKNELEEVARLIMNSSHVYFFGNGTSGYAADVGAYRFFRSGVFCEGVTDVHMMVMKAALMRKDELVVAVSLSGDNTDIVQAVKLAKKINCKIVTITGSKLSVLAQYGDINLVHAPVSFNDESYYGGITGIIIQEFILETIFGIYARLNPDRIDEVQQMTAISTNLHHFGLHTKDDE